MDVIDCRPWNKRNLNSLLRDSTPSDALGYLFVPLGKAANTEVKRRLWELEVEAGSSLPVPEDYFAVHNYQWVGKVDEWNVPWDCYAPGDIDRLMADLMNKYVFTVVRNPYAKLLSAYLDKIAKLQAKVEAEVPDERINRFSLPEVPGSFAEFVEMVCMQSDKEVDLHWAGQSYKTLFDFVKYNHIGHFEDLETHFDRIAARFSRARPKLENKALHATSASRRIQEFYTETLAEKVHDRYREDFAIFGYSADLFSGDLAPVRPVLSSGRYCDFARQMSRVVKHLQSGERRKARAVIQKAQDRANRIHRELVLDESLRGLVKPQAQVERNMA